MESIQINITFEIELLEDEKKEQVIKEETESLQKLQQEFYRSKRFKPLIFEYKINRKSYESKNPSE